MRGKKKEVVRNGLAGAVEESSEGEGEEGDDDE
jgi:hypothetical protein